MQRSKATPTGRGLGLLCLLCLLPLLLATVSATSSSSDEVEAEKLSTGKEEDTGENGINTAADVDATTVALAVAVAVDGANDVAANTERLELMLAPQLDLKANVSLTQGTQGAKCGAVGQYCRLAEDCCSKRCLTYRARCVT